MWHETHVTKMFTPLQLHEIMEIRHYDAAGNVNALNQAQMRPQNRLSIDLEAASFVVEDEGHWTPKGVISMLDAFDSVLWCWTLVQLGHELHIAEYMDWWKMLVRGKAQRLEQLKQHWTDMSWRACLAMRQGVQGHLPRDHGRSVRLATGSAEGAAAFSTEGSSQEQLQPAIPEPGPRQGRSQG